MRTRPVFLAEPAAPVSPAYHAGVMEGAAHPKTTHLFAIFLTQQAQGIWGKCNRPSSAFISNTNLPARILVLSAVIDYTATSLLTSLPNLASPEPWHCRCGKGHLE
ncbi:MAG TPA: hypothetical protein VE131_13945 [Terriglobales bacterium]|nr:hypothetical protein [Terriglobales bacterium]